MKRNLQMKIFTGLLIVGLIMLLFFSLQMGNYSLSLSDTLRYFVRKLSGGEYEAAVETVLLNRLLRIITAIVIGAALAIAGAVYQNVFSNNMVSPDLLGVSSSAACGASVAIIMGMPKSISFAWSFLFSVIAILATGLVSRILKIKERLLFSGVIIAGVARSGLGLLKYIADPENGELESIVYWEMGSLAKVTWNDLLIIVPAIVIIIVVLYALRRRIAALSLGLQASLLGIRVPLEKTLIIAISSLLVSLCTAVCGVISWIGLVIPAAITVTTKNGSIEKSFVVTGLTGSLFLLVADDLARAATSSEIPISIMTGAAGLLILLVAICTGKEKGRL